MKKILKVLIYLFLAIGFILYVLVNHSYRSDQSFECEVVEEYPDFSRDNTIFIRLKTFRWWVYLWGDGSDGELLVELDGRLVNYFSIEKQFDASTVRILTYPKRSVGQFSLMSNRINLRLTDDWQLSGICKAMDTPRL